MIIKQNTETLNGIIEQINNLKFQTKYFEAFQLCEKTVDDYDNGLFGNDQTILSVLIEEVHVLERMSRYEEAEGVMSFFEKVIKKNKIDDQNLFKKYSLAKGLLAERRNQLTLAESQYKKILKYLEKSGTIDDTIYETNLRLAYVYLTMNEPKRAFGNIKNAKNYLNSFVKFEDEVAYKKLYSAILIFEGKAYSQIGQFEDSIIHYNKARSLLEEANLIDLDYAQILIESSILLLKTGNTEGIEERLKIAKELFDETDFLAYRIDYYYALKLYNDGELEKSLKIILDIYENSFPRLSNEYCEQLELEVISKIATIYNELGDNSKSLQFLDILNNELFITINKSAKKLSHHERFYFLNSIYNVMLNVYEFCETYSTLSIQHKNTLYVFRVLLKLIEDYEVLDKIPTADFISKCLYEDSVIVDIIRVQNNIQRNSTTNYFAFIVDEDINIIKIENATKLENEFYADYLKSLKRKSLDLRSFNNYWAQINSLIESKKHIYITAEGFYNHINIENLLTPEGEYYYEMYHVYKFQNYFGRQRINDDCLNEAFVVGNPSFEIKKKARYKNPPEYIPTKPNAEIKDLPYSKAEGRKISQILTDSKYRVIEYYNEDANYKNLSTVMSPKILHIATHGFNFDSMGNTKGIADWENLSGLLLSNSIVMRDNEKYYNNSGMLYSGKIKKLKLKNTKLAVLSACYSGSGFLLNIGSTIGLQKAIFIAGVETIIVALWEIEDSVSYEFMTEFYTEWVKEEDIGLSFYVAKTIIKKKYIHPFYWAGFKIIHKTLFKS